MTAATPLSILLLGSGGREHALAWGLTRSKRLGRLVCAPGNPGMATIAECEPCDVLDPEAVVLLAQRLNVDLVIVGPEAPLEVGVSNALMRARVPVFGPSQEASRLEWDKAFAKDFMERHSIPTASSQSFGADALESAIRFARIGPFPRVVKACGLAAGKGVIIADNADEAEEAVRLMLVGNAFGRAGSRIVVEEFMHGEEASIFAVTDGTRYVIMAPSQDHKQVDDGDKGANTGGMGAYAPASIVSDDIMEQVRREVVEPTLLGMSSAGTPYVGCLYVGLMIDRNGYARVVEFNSRFGDPETQVIVPIYDGDLLELIWSAATGALPATGIAPFRGAAACVILSSGGYPGAYRTGLPITGIPSKEESTDVEVFHAGTENRDGTLVTAGGRVLGVTAYDAEGNLDRAISKAYDVARQVRFEGAH